MKLGAPPSNAAPIYGKGNVRIWIQIVFPFDQWMKELHTFIGIQSHLYCIAFCILVESNFVFAVIGMAFANHIHIGIQSHSHSHRNT